MRKLITIKEVSVLTGKAEITIRRLLKRLEGQKGVKAKKVIVRQKIPSGYTYSVDKEFLLTEMDMGHLLSTQMEDQKSRRCNEVSNQMNRPKRSSRGDGDDTSSAKRDTRSDGTVEMLKETIGILREQLQAKDNQLSDKHQENQELIRGNRESIATVNILTKRLLLDEGSKERDPEPEIVSKAPVGAERETAPAKKGKRIYIQGVGTM